VIKVIGQKETKEFVLNSEKPCILVGKRGMGKLTLVKELFPAATIIGNGEDNIKVDDIRVILENAVNTYSQCYVIRNVDNMNVHGQNALLKILEECPLHIKFVILCEELSRVLQTIKSRCNIRKMELYTNSEIEEYVKLNYPNIKKFGMLQNYCMGVLGRVDRIAGKTFKDIRDVCISIVFNLPRTSTGNLFNIVTHLQPFEKDLDLVLDTLMIFYSDLHQVKSGVESQIIDTLLLDRYKEFEITPKQCMRNIMSLDAYKRKMGVPYNFTMFVDTLMMRLKGVV
jgi:DNA polymerase-3 subunit delta'